MGWRLSAASSAAVREQSQKAQNKKQKLPRANRKMPVPVKQPTVTAVRFAG